VWQVLKKRSHLKVVKRMRSASEQERERERGESSLTSATELYGHVPIVIVEIILHCRYS
jgi:hypothetical protein